MPTKKKKIHEYRGGRIKGLVEKVFDILKNEPHLDIESVHTILKRNLEGYGEREQCFNCNRSMKISVYTADVLDGLLILAMAKKVQENIDSGMDFTIANKVHIPTVPATQGILKRQTKCDYLGLIKQPKEFKGSGYWVLTTWAWRALAGGRIPKSAKYWEGKLIERSEETTSLDEMFQTHTDTVQRAIQKRHKVRTDHRHHISTYKQSEWSQYDGTIDDTTE